MTLGQQAAAIWKWGNRYPKLFPLYQIWSAELYKLDRIQRGVE